MNVKLITITPNAGDLIAYCARVSNPANQANNETAPRLLAYLVRNKHWSPFEMAHCVMEIVTTRDIARQMLRHRSFSFQEFSQRYAEVVSEPVISEARMQDAKNRQASHETDDSALQGWWESAQRAVAQYADQMYREALGHGLAKEVARKVLSEGLTESTLYMAGSVRSWIHYCEERTKPGVQKEHRIVAEACKAILLINVPALTEVLQ